MPDTPAAVHHLRPLEAANNNRRTIACPLKWAPNFAVANNSDSAADAVPHWLRSLFAQFRPTDALTLDIDLHSQGLSLGIAYHAVADEHDPRASDLGASLVRIAKLAFGDLAPGHCARLEPRPAKFVQVVSPGGRALSLGSPAHASPRAVTTSVPANLYLRAEPHRRPDLAAVALVLADPALAAVQLHLELTPRHLDAVVTRSIADTLRELSSKLADAKLDTLFHLDDAALAHLKSWCVADRGLALTARLEGDQPIPPVIADLVCQALYGDIVRQTAPDAALDLTTAWPQFDFAFLERLSGVARLHVHLQTKRAVAALPIVDSLRLGNTHDGHEARLALALLEQHLHLIGGTGTGKSTLLAHLIQQLIARGAGVFLFDPQGDLWDRMLSLIAPDRADDLVLVHPTDPRGHFELNPLLRVSPDAVSEADFEAEYARITDELIDLFKRTLWPNTPEAFGPMFEQYMRNALMLLLSAQGSAASLVDFPRIFTDSTFRRELLARCKLASVKTIWKMIIDTGGEASLDNVAPYVVSKISPLLANPTLRRITTGTGTQLDMGELMRNKKIVLINLALPELGGGASRFLGGLLTNALAEAANGQAKLRPADRVRTYVVLDEFHTYLSAKLADGLALLRKFGLSFVLAHQSLHQLAASAYQPEVAQAVLANVANLIAFRISVHDAHVIAQKFGAPSAATALARLPNYMALTTIGSVTGSTDPVCFQTEPDPSPISVPPPLPEPAPAPDLADVRGRLIACFKHRAAAPATPQIDDNVWDLPHQALAFASRRRH